MKLLIMNASPRKKGNSEILGAIALKEAMRAEVDSAEIVHLRDYRIEQCTGCMRCVFNEERCHLDDDFYAWYDKMATADALFLAAPTYVTTIPGSLKTLFDRYLCIPPLYEKLFGLSLIHI